jgi:hypothetical protein
MRMAYTERRGRRTGAAVQTLFVYRAGKKGSSMRPMGRPQRVLEVVERLPLYELVGRRPSRVFLDDTLTPTTAAAAPHRLSDLVYRRAFAEPGDQLHVMSGQTLLLDRAHTYRAVLLSEPRPLELATALVHAQQVREEETAAIERQAVAGTLIEALARQPKVHQVTRAEQRFAADHPLIVEPAAAGGRRPRAAAAERVRARASS